MPLDQTSLELAIILSFLYLANKKKDKYRLVKIIVDSIAPTKGRSALVFILSLI
jgi:hypothetical protein